MVLTANHHDSDISDVEGLAQRGALVKQEILEREGVSGAVVLSTCNRYEVYLEADETAARDVAELLGIDHSISVFSGLDAARHLYEVASGLDSMVVGEREIVGQVRQALASARKEGTTSPLLEQTIQGALRTSREVAVKTDFLPHRTFYCRRGFGYGGGGCLRTRPIRVGRNRWTHRSRNRLGRNQGPPRRHRRLRRSDRCGAAGTPC